MNLYRCDVLIEVNAPRRKPSDLGTVLKNKRLQITAGVFPQEYSKVNNNVLVLIPPNAHGGDFVLADGKPYISETVSYCDRPLVKEPVQSSSLLVIGDEDTVETKHEFLAAYVQLTNECRSSVVMEHYALAHHNIASCANALKRFRLHSARSCSLSA